MKLSQEMRLGFADLEKENHEIAPNHGRLF